MFTRLSDLMVTELNAGVTKCAITNKINIDMK